MDGKRVAMDPRILDAYVDNRPSNTTTGGSVASLRQGTLPPGTASPSIPDRFRG